MGSLLPGWDSKKKLRTPKAMRDFEEPSKIPSSPRGAFAKPATPVTCPPKLGRTSCPPSLHGTVFPGTPTGRTEPAKTSAGEQEVLSRLARTSLSPSSPRGRPTPASPFSPSSAPGSSLFARLLDRESGEDVDKQERWCARVDSSALNERPDDPSASLEEWRRGSFTPNDPLRTMRCVETAGCGGGGDAK